jgi:hypothetical protein
MRQITTGFWQWCDQVGIAAVVNCEGNRVCDAPEYVRHTPGPDVIGSRTGADRATGTILLKIFRALCRKWREMNGLAQWGSSQK